MLQFGMLGKVLDWTNRPLEEGVRNMSEEKNCLYCDFYEPTLGHCRIPYECPYEYIDKEKGGEHDG